MNYFSTNKIRKSLVNTAKDPKDKKNILEFFSDDSIFNKLNVNKLYIPKGTDEIHISQDDFEKLILLAALKINRKFKSKRVGTANPEIYKEMESFNVSNLNEVKNIIASKMENGDAIKLVEQISTAATALKEKLVKEMPEKLNEKRIVSIDFEFSNKKDLITEMGVTVKQGDNIISKHYLIKGAYQIKSDASLQRRFRFGKTEKVSVDQMKDIINKQLELADYALFHAHKEDMRLLGIYGIWINEYPKLNILDTQLLEGRLMPLQRMLDKYEIEHAGKELHNSGNDAYYTMKLLEKLNIKSNPELTVDIDSIVENKRKMVMKI